MITFSKSSIYVTVLIVSIFSCGFGLNAVSNSRNVHEVSAFLAKNKKNPEAVMLMIEDVCVADGACVAFDKLTKAFDQAKIAIETIKSDRGLTVLHNACFRGFVRSLFGVLWIAKDPSDFILACDQDGWSPLHYAAVHGHTKLVKILLKIAVRHDKVNDLINIKNKQGATALDLAQHYDQDYGRWDIIMLLSRSAKL